MKEPEVYSLNDIARDTGEDGLLVGYLVVDRGIPHKKLGPVKVVDSHGRKLLLAALAEYREKAGPIVPRNVGRPRKRRPEPVAS